MHYKERHMYTHMYNFCHDNSVICTDTVMCSETERINVCSQRCQERRLGQACKIYLQPHVSFIFQLLHPICCDILSIYRNMCLPGLVKIWIWDILPKVFCDLFQHPVIRTSSPQNWSFYTVASWTTLPISIKIGSFFSKYRVQNFGNRQTDGRTDDTRTCVRPQQSHKKKCAWPESQPWSVQWTCQADLPWHLPCRCWTAEMSHGM